MEHDGMAWFLLILAGLITGSFCNVVIHRLPRGVSLVAPARSVCPKCGATIPAVRNIPIVSWILLRGRAKCCGGLISPRYIAVEMLVPSLWALVYLRIGFTPLLPVLLLFAAGGICVAAIDMDTQRIPHPLTATLACLAAAGAVVVAIVPGPSSPNGDALPSIFVPVFCGLLAVIFLGSTRVVCPSGMGGGDVRLAFSVACVAAVGAGWQGSLVAVLSSCTSAGLLGCVLVAVASARGRRGESLRSIPIPFGPHLATGGLVGAMWGQYLWGTYLSLAS